MHQMFKLKERRHQVKEKYKNISVGGYFCKEIKELSSEIGRIGLGQDFINLKNEKDFRCKKIRAFYMKVKLKIFHFITWRRMATLYKDYAEYGKSTLFLNDESDSINKHWHWNIHKELYIYDPEEIDPINLWVLCLFSNLKMCEGDLFAERDEFKEILKEKGYTELAKYLEGYAIHWDSCLKEL